MSDTSTRDCEGRARRIRGRPHPKGAEQSSPGQRPGCRPPGEKPQRGETERYAPLGLGEL